MGGSILTPYNKFNNRSKTNTIKIIICSLTWLYISIDRAKVGFPNYDF